MQALFNAFNSRYRSCFLTIKRIDVPTKIMEFAFFDNNLTGFKKNQISELSGKQKSGISRYRFFQNYRAIK
ncbi:hypothetical protein SAMN04488057_110113 [Cyclobacterium lianum]|uniref:Uncharacterized protein n=1 Tax=Cyclobacterium lianum TaxID=388280 RepID=A0A1M7PT60_9BACT|nr:hypothetical protein SAMN04488057_110113 [Cyclobacterium lianum]